MSDVREEKSKWTARSHLNPSKASFSAMYASRGTTLQFIHKENLR